VTGFIVKSQDPEGDEAWSQIVYRFDSLNELSAKTIANKLFDDGHTKIEILELEMKPIYRLIHEWQKL
jgi:hypothetical protein